MTPVETPSPAGSVLPVILCGGAGTRLWPASRPSFPKQFVPLTGPRSSFQETVLRIVGLKDARAPLIIAGAAHEALIRAQLAEIEIEADLILEPEGRDSCAAIAVAAQWAMASNVGIVVALAADHHIGDAAAFRAALERAVGAARADRSIVTLGVRPTVPATAYGYIRPGAAIAGTDQVLEVGAFVEKPDRARAAAYLAEGYLWNSGNFVFPAVEVVHEIERLAPDVAACVRRALEAADFDGVHLGAAFLEAPRISFDHAVMEKTPRVAVAPVEFVWSDLGAWDAVLNASKRDGNGNGVSGQAVMIDTDNCLIQTSAIPVVAIGVSNLAVIATPAGVIVCNLDRAQDVKAAVAALKAKDLYAD